MENLDIEEKYIHIEYTPRDSMHPTGGSLLLPIYGIEVDPNVYSLLYGLNSGAPYVEICNRNAIKLSRGYEKEIHTAEDMTLFLQNALRPTDTLHKKVDSALGQLDRILMILDPPPQPERKAPPQPKQKAPPQAWWRFGY
jgi:hypothetical protein